MAYAVRDQGIAMHGFTALQQALLSIQERADYGMAYELQARLRLLGEKIAKDAPGFVTHYSGHRGPYPKEPDNPRLGESVRVNVTTRAASIYSTAMHGGVQNVGGQVGRGRSALIERAKASHWMSKAVSTNYAFLQMEIEGLLDWVVREFQIDYGD